ncbi:MAG TPA: alpha/beta fold hydrolase [Kofleriaceae bacterium]|nr:alpha/beta fold hydrolase [Kofleriaceae bacterium]
MIETRYARSGDLSIAWQSCGEGPVDLLIVPGLISHVEAFHELPGYTRFVARLAGLARVITFDKRGNGLSDRVADVPSLPERMDDVRAVLDAARSERTILLGLSEGGALAIHFAATEPARVAALALFGAFPRMLAAPGYEPGLPPDAYEQFSAEMIEGWGTGVPLLTLFGPSLAHAHARIREVAARCERLSATPTTMRGLWRMNASIDVRDALPRVRAPTLIMHRQGDRVVPIAAARWLAAHLPDARLIELAGADHLPFIGDFEPVVTALAPLFGAHAPTDATPTSAATGDSADPAGPADPDPATPALPSGRSVDAAALDRLFAGTLGGRPVQIGRFLVERALGSGGMGTVFLAEDRDLGRPVALKVLHKSGEDAYRRFRREATAVAQLSHPQVVQVHELGLDASVPYLVMEYVPGGTAADLGDRPLPWRRATQIIASAARGLGAAHAVGIIHRDVKPANLLLTDHAGASAKIADFGIAKLAGGESQTALTREGIVVGTLGYLAPEQARGEAVDARADVWALGATWFRLLTGRRFFDGTVAEILAATITKEIPDPRQYADMPAPVAALVLRMCALDRAARPVDGQAAADELEALLRAAPPAPCFMEAPCEAPLREALLAAS